MAVAEPVALIEGFAGEILQPGDPTYDEVRRVHNGLIDRRPALIARCSGTADVVGAVNAAREEGWELSVRGGGHNVAGTAVTDGGLMIDLSTMKGIHVDPAARTVRAQGGVLWKELNRETQLHGLAVTGGAISTTGIAGLTLGGGLGWLMTKLGLAADNLLSVELVTADGSVLTVSADEHPDLFWGLRGGGGNFGVATSLEYRLHPIGPMITGGLIAHPLDAAGDLLRFMRDFADGIPDDLMFVAGCVHAPDGSGMPLAAVGVCHSGTLEDAENDLKPLLEYGSPAMAMIGPMPYEAVCQMLDEAYPRGAAQLLEVDLPQRADRRRDRHDGRAVRELPVADDGHDRRALPRRGDACACRGDRRPSPRAWLQPRDHGRLDGPRDDGGERLLGARDVRRAGAVCRLAPLAELPPGGGGGRRGAPGCVRPELRAARRAEDPVRPEQPVPPEREHQAALVGCRREARL